MRVSSKLASLMRLLLAETTGRPGWQEAAVLQDVVLSRLESFLTESIPASSSLLHSANKDCPWLCLRGV